VKTKAREGDDPSRRGKDAGSITTKWLGEADPVAPNTKPDGSDNPEGRKQNRRVQIVVTK
jgi:photosystem I P700 chlorophyll a apoprotein A2